MADELIAALADLAEQASPGWAHIVRGPYPAALGEGRYGVEVRDDGGVLLLVDGPPSGLMRESELSWLFDRGGCFFRSVEQYREFLDGPLRDALRGSSAEAAMPDPQQILEALSTEVCGQAAALIELSEQLAAHVVKRTPTQPLSLFLLGPSGVGKTVTARAVGQALRSVTGGEWPEAIVAGSEINQPIQLTRILGAPAGYVGHGPAPLAEVIAAGPGVLVFDEIEKAHESVLSEVLLGLMDRGEITAPDGSLVRAAGSVLLFTSNLAADELADVAGLPPAWVDQQCRDQLRSKGLGEHVVGRISRFVVLDALDAVARHQAAVRQVQVVAAEYGIEVAEVAEEASSYLAATASRDGGVRMIAHVVRREFALDLARHAASGTRQVCIDSELRVTCVDGPDARRGGGVSTRP